MNWEKYKKEYIHNFDLSNSYLFESQLKRLDFIVKQSVMEDNDSNKIIGIVGERGSGKSSLLYTYRELIKLEKSKENSNLYILNPINPDYLNKRMGLMEIILTNLYIEVEDYLERHVWDIDSNSAKKILLQITEQIQLQTNLRTESNFRKESSPESLLSEFQDRLKLKETYNTLFRDIWCVLKNKHSAEYIKGNFIILIDDVDLIENNYVFDMLEDVRKYLMSNATVILTYRNEQLRNSIYSVKLSSLQGIKDDYELDFSEEAKNQTDSYLEKLISAPNTIVMNNSREILNKKISEIFEKEDYENLVKNKLAQNENVKIVDLVYDLVKERVLIDIKSRNYSERKRFESMFNLRFLLQYLEYFISKLEKLSFSEKSEGLACLGSNILKLEEFIEVNLSQLMTRSQRELINEWKHSYPEHKNFTLYKSLLDSNREYLNKLSPRYFTELNLKEVEYYNVNLGDVVKILKAIQDNNNDTLVYILKILYSLELLKSLITEIYVSDTSNNINYKNMKFKEPNERDHNIYLASLENQNINEFSGTTYYYLTKYKIIPDDFQFLSNEKEMKIRYTKPQSSNLFMVQTLDKILYTTVPSSGDIYISARKEGGEKLNRRAYNYRVRPIYNPSFNGDTKIPVTHFFESESYRNIAMNNMLLDYDPFTMLVKEQNVEVARHRKTYLFYSLFDLDIILRVTYDRKQSGVIKIKDFFNKVNTTVQEIFEKTKNLGNCLSTEKYQDLYSEEEINFLSREIIEPNHPSEMATTLTKDDYLLDTLEEFTQKSRRDFKDYQGILDHLKENEGDYKEFISSQQLSELKEISEENELTHGQKAKVREIIKELFENKKLDVRARE